MSVLGSTGHEEPIHLQMMVLGIEVLHKKRQAAVLSAANKDVRSAEQGQCAGSAGAVNSWRAAAEIMEAGVFAYAESSHRSLRKGSNSSMETCRPWNMLW